MKANFSDGDSSDPVAQKGSSFLLFYTLFLISEPTLF